MRVKNWVQKLEEEILFATDRRFSWGEHDCALFACNCILAMTDNDPAAKFRGKYSNKQEATAALEDFAGGGLLECAQEITKASGFEEVLPDFAGRGDVVIINLDGDPALGIIDLSGRNILVASEHGITTRPFSAIVKAWRVD